MSQKRWEGISISSEKIPIFHAVLALKLGRKQQKMTVCDSAKTGPHINIFLFESVVTGS